MDLRHNWLHDDTWVIEMWQTGIVKMHGRESGYLASDFYSDVERFPRVKRGDLFNPPGADRFGKLTLDQVVLACGSFAIIRWGDTTTASVDQRRWSILASVDLVCQYLPSFSTTCPLPFRCHPYATGAPSLGISGAQRCVGSEESRYVPLVSRVLFYTGGEFLLVLSKSLLSSFIYRGGSWRFVVIHRVVLHPPPYLFKGALLHFARK